MAEWHVFCGTTSNSLHVLFSVREKYSPFYSHIPAGCAFFLFMFICSAGPVGFAWKMTDSRRRQEGSGRDCSWEHGRFGGDFVSLGDMGF